MPLSHQPSQKLTRKLFKTLSAHNGLLPEFRAIDNPIPEDFELGGLFALGIFNPFGLTITTIAKVSRPNEHNFLLLLSSLNPFATEHLLLVSAVDHSLLHLVDSIKAAFRVESESVGPMEITFA
jgi:hypothetical protein